MPGDRRKEVLHTKLDRVAYGFLQGWANISDVRKSMPQKILSRLAQPRCLFCSMRRLAGSPGGQARRYGQGGCCPVKPGSRRVQVHVSFLVFSLFVLVSVVYFLPSYRLLECFFFLEFCAYLCIVFLSVYFYVVCLVVMLVITVIHKQLVTIY